MRWPGRRLRRCFYSFAVAGLIFSVGASGCADELVLGWNHSHVNPGRAEQHLVRVGRCNVEYWAANSPGAVKQPPRATVLMFTGKADRAEKWVAMVADAWGDLPVQVCGMNYPGSGGSDPPVKLLSVLPAALGVYDAIDLGSGHRPIFIQSASFGTTAALAVAARRPVAGLILQNPVPLRQLLLEHYGWWNLWLVAAPVAARIPANLDAIANARLAQAPVVFICCLDDEVVPHSFHELVVDAYHGPKRVIQMANAKHAASLTDTAAEELRLDRQWLWDQSAAAK